MDMFDEARAIAGTLALCKLTQSQLAKQMGVSQSYIANKLRLLGFSDEERDIIKNGKITERHARAILRLKGTDERIMLLKRLTSRPLTVRECEAMVDAAVERDAPRRIGTAEKRCRISTFFDTVKESVNTLSSLGINAKMTQSYYGDKTYLTIVIEEE